MPADMVAKIPPHMTAFTQGCSNDGECIFFAPYIPRYDRVRWAVNLRALSRSGRAILKEPANDEVESDEDVAWRQLLCFVFGFNAKGTPRVPENVFRLIAGFL